MKNNKKGFTLIELLAVIVILAIIALIAVPTIMGIINKANKSAFKDTAYGIISAGELYYAEQQLEVNGMSEDKTFDLATDVNVEGGLQIKGEVPSGGKLVVNTNGQTALSTSNGRYCITKRYNDNDITVTEDSNNCYFPYSLPALATTSTEVTSIASCLTDGTECVAGTAFAIQVNDSETKNFYVIKDIGTKVTLIMSANLGDRVAWYADAQDNSFGPLKALEYLNSQTSNWKYIEPIKDYTYDNNLNGTTNKYGYQKLEIENGLGKITSQDGNTITELEGTSRARLITYEELTALRTANSGTMPTYLYGNLSGLNTTEAPYGYWQLTAHPSFSNNVRGVYSSDNIISNVYGGTDSLYGVRPVIELSK